MPSFCAVAYCEFKYAQSTSISFHKFPFHTAHLLNQWIAFTNRGALWQPSRWSSICSRHFRISDYRDHLFRKCLKRTAVPTVRVQLPFSFVAASKEYESATQMPSHSAVSTISEAADVVVGEQSEPERTHPIQSPPSSSASTSISAASSSQYLQYCRLCANTDPGTRHLDESAIANALHKYCPSLTLDSDVRLSRLVCSDCLLQLNRFVQFVDRIVSMQTDLIQRLVPITASNGSKATPSTNPECVPEPTDTTTNADALAMPPPPTPAPLLVKRRRSLTSAMTTPANQLPKIVHIKQEPVLLLANVKQEFSDSNRTSVAHLPIKFASNMEFQPDADAFCETCDVYFINNLELKTHIINCHKSALVSSPDLTKTDPHDLPSQSNSNCEIMEIITLENAFINLAEEAEPDCALDDGLTATAYDMIPLERVLKVEHFNDYEQRELQLTVIRREHNYNRRLEVSELPARSLGDFKQEFKTNESTMEAAVVLQSLSTLMPANSALLAEQVSNASDHTKHMNKPVDRPTQQPSVYQCDKCLLQYACLSTLNQHIEATHRQFKCSQCERRFSSRMQRLQHLLYDHQRPVALCRRPPITLICSHCSHKFYTKVAWKNHRIVCDRWHKVMKPFLRARGPHRPRSLSRIRCKIVSRLLDRSTVSYADRCSSLMTKSNTRFECEKCRRTFRHYHSYTRHLKMHLPVTDLLKSQRPVCNATPLQQNASEDNCAQTIATFIVNPFTCSECHAEFTLEQTYQDHLRTVHPTTSAPPQPPTAAVKPNRTFVCPKCDKQFRCAENLRQHTITHSTLRNYACNLCDKVFKRSSGLKQHVQGFHYKIRPHVCTVCQYAYALKGDMKRCRHSRSLVAKVTMLTNATQ